MVISTTWESIAELSVALVVEAVMEGLNSWKQLENNKLNTNCCRRTYLDLNIRRRIQNSENMKK